MNEPQRAPEWELVRVHETMLGSADVLIRDRKSRTVYGGILLLLPPQPTTGGAPK